MCICWHCFFFFLNRNLGSHSWIMLLRVVAWIQVFFFFLFVSSDTRIPEDTRAQYLRGPPSSCFLGATHNHRSHTNATRMLCPQENHRVHRSPIPSFLKPNPLLCKQSSSLTIEPNSTNKPNLELI